MKGAIADPAAKIMIIPNARRITIAGANQNFFLCFRNPHKSLKNSIISPLIRFLDVLALENMVPYDQSRILACLETA
jgi:hypothetical protein